MSERASRETWRLKRRVDHIARMLRDLSPASQSKRLVVLGRSSALQGLVRQIVIWLGFVVGFALVSSLAGNRAHVALANGLRVVEAEKWLLHGLPELVVQRTVASSAVLTFLTVLTYRASEFVVVSAALVWVYLRRRWAFTQFRNTIFAASLVALVCYFVLPTAPPRMFPGLGFVDTVAHAGGPSRDPGVLSLAANEYAAMPSLHAADALIVGVAIALLARRRLVKVVALLWPAWVWLCVMATGNHFALDVVAGTVVAVLSGAAVHAHARAFPSSSADSPASALR